MNRLALTLAAGPASSDLSGTGTTGVRGAAFDVSLLPFLVVEPSVRYLSYSTQFGQENSYLLSDLSVQVEIPAGAVRPYAGGGVGAAVIFGDGDGTDFTLHTALGARIGLANRWQIQPEARLRTIDPFAGSTLELTLGCFSVPASSSAAARIVDSATSRDPSSNCSQASADSR